MRRRRQHICERSLGVVPALRHTSIGEPVERLHQGRHFARLHDDRQVDVTCRSSQVDVRLQRSSANQDKAFHAEMCPQFAEGVALCDCQRQPHGSRSRCSRYWSYKMAAASPARESSSASRSV